MREQAEDKMDIPALLGPYRARIDALDDQIIDLLTARTEIIREVADVKAERGIPAILPDRVEQVRERAACRAAEKGLDAEIIRQIYRILIDYSCGLEETIMNERRQQQQSQKTAGRG